MIARTGKLESLNSELLGAEIKFRASLRTAIQKIKTEAGRKSFMTFRDSIHQLFSIWGVRGTMMASVFDVAAYILKKQGGMTSMKLQKLVYYAQAWSLVWDERPIFKEPIEAWANGPVVSALFKAHQGEFTVTRAPKGDIAKLDDDARETIKAVLNAYGDKAANWLSALTHREDPWVNARRGLADGERGNRVITHGAMADYYGNL